MPVLCFSVEQKQLEKGALHKRCSFDNHDISQLEFYSNTNAKMTDDCCVLQIPPA